MERTNLNRSRVIVLAGAAALLLTGMLATTDSETRPVGTLLAMAQDRIQPARGTSAATLQLAGDTIEPRLIEVPSSTGASPESRLISIYRLIAAHRLDEALNAAESLTRESPNFKLAQLVYADLLSARSAPLTGFGAAATRETPATAELAVLRDEARLRLRALQERPPEGAVPDELVLLPSSIRYAIAVDTSRARLYLFENSDKGVRLVSDYYVSVGKQGVDKVVEGDQRTPLGVYFITDRIDARSLEDRFGAGALPLNYPNAYDKSRGRTGSGILLHGVPSNTYSRPPLDSDGCVALANEDLLRLAGQLPQRDTPVIITRQIKWVTEASSAAGPRQAFLDTVKRWQEARLRADRATLDALYLAAPANGSATESAIDPKLRQRLATPASGIDNVSVLTWHDDKDMMVVTFRELTATGSRRDRVVRQYWGRNGSDWRIVAEGPVR